MTMNKVIGHRGLAGEAPENTLASISQAARQGLSWIEVDVTLLGDGTTVLFHDRRLNRTTNHTGRLKSLTHTKLTTIDAGSWFSAQFAGEPIPELGTALSLIKELGLGLNLELKTNGCHEGRLVDAVLKALGKTDLSREQLRISSFNHRALVCFSTHSQLPVAHLFDRLPLNWRRKAERTGAVAIHLNAAKVSQKQILKVRSAGYELYCYTVNSQSFARNLIDNGVNGVFSDYPLEGLYPMDLKLIRGGK